MCFVFPWYAKIENYLNRKIKNVKPRNVKGKKQKIPEKLFGDLKQNYLLNNNSKCLQRVLMNE
ncbi:hypothetical protein GCM10027442_09130 [Emticicia fontis]